VKALHNPGVEDKVREKNQAHCN